MKYLHEAGDTIVEVLIAIAIIGVVLVGAYQSTSRNIASTQDAQERTQAVKLAESQLELVRNVGSKAVSPPQCLSKQNSTDPLSMHANSGSKGSNPCIVDSSSMQASETTEPAYTLAISSPSSNLYKVKVMWDSIVDSGQSNVTMYYEQP